MAIPWGDGDGNNNTSDMMERKAYRDGGRKGEVDESLLIKLVAKESGFSLLIQRQTDCEPFHEEATIDRRHKWFRWRRHPRNELLIAVDCLSFRWAVVLSSVGDCHDVMILMMTQLLEYMMASERISSYL